MGMHQDPAFLFQTNGTLADLQEEQTALVDMVPLFSVNRAIYRDPARFLPQIRGIRDELVGAYRLVTTMYYRNMNALEIFGDEDEEW